jgi:hypothetical protein
MMPGEDPLIGRMVATLEGWEQRGDGRCVYLRCFTLMTRSIYAAARAGRFDDGPWIERILRQSAERYFHALDLYELGDPSLPEVWKRTHDLARGCLTTVAEDLVLGVNAHINYDLTLTIADVLDPKVEELSAAHLEARYEDFNRINTLIAETTDAVQREVCEHYARLLAVFDAVCGCVDEWTTAHYIASWREEMWKRAVRLAAERDPARHARLRGQVGRDALKRVELIFIGHERARVFGYPLQLLRRMRLL